MLIFSVDVPFDLSACSCFGSDNLVAKINENQLLRIEFVYRIITSLNSFSDD